MVNVHLHCRRCCNLVWVDEEKKPSIHVKKCDHSVCMTGSGILVMAVGSSGGGWECDHRAHWPPRLHVFLSCLGPKTWTITSLNVYCRSTVWQTTAGSHPHRGENDNLGDDCPLRSPVKMEHFFFYSTSEGAVIVPRPGSGRQGGGEHVTFMSIIRSGAAPLSVAAERQSAAATCWTPTVTFQSCS